MTAFEVPADLTFNRGRVDDPEALARDTEAASWLYLCGDEFAAMEGGMSFDQVQAADPVWENIISDPPRILDIDLARRHMAARPARRLSPAGSAPAPRRSSISNRGSAPAPPPRTFSPAPTPTARPSPTLRIRAFVTQGLDELARE